jgi:hypothetical protein
MLKCWQRTHLQRCLVCHERDYAVPTTVCDYFRPKYVSHSFRRIRIRKRGPSKFDILNKKLDELLKN